MLAVLTLGAAPAAADEFADLVGEARAAFDRRMFARSAELLQKARALRPEPLLVYNMGRSYQEAGMWDEALAAFAEFLLAAPRGQERTLAEARVREALAAKGTPALPACSGVTCPVLDGHRAACNAAGACELTRTGDAPAWERGLAWVYLPGGPYELAGGVSSPRTVILAGVLVGKHEASVAASEACVAAGRCTPPSAADWSGEQGANGTAAGRGDHPQNALTWQQARDLCTFLGGRLPSEAEWEAAAAGPSPRPYPWGDAPPSCAAGRGVWAEGGGTASWGCGRGGTAPLKGRPAGASPLGAEDMAGNLWEWVEDCWHADLAAAPSDGSPWTTACEGPKRVIRGGSYYGDDPAELRTTRRDPHIPTTRRAHIGVRCARDAQPTK